jgi:hypothetical protein
MILVGWLMEWLVASWLHCIPSGSESQESRAWLCLLYRAIAYAKKSAAREEGTKPNLMPVGKHKLRNNKDLKMEWSL